MCDHCEVKPPPPVKQTVRAEYVAAKERVTKVEGDLRSLSNKLFTLLGEAEEKATASFRATLERERIAAIDRFKEEHEKDYARLDELRVESSKAQREFASFKFDCNHKDERGESAVQPFYPLMSSIEDKPTMKCSICAEVWK